MVVRVADLWTVVLVALGDGASGLGFGDSGDRSRPEGMAYRSGAIAVSTVLAITFCLVIPGQTGARSRLGAMAAGAGRYTMYPYLSLPLFTVLSWTGWAQRDQPLTATIAAISLGLAVSIVKVTPPVRALTKVFVEGLVARARRRH